MTTYDPITQTYTDVSPLNRQIKTKLNNFEQVVEEKYANYASYVYAYDTFGRLDTITQSARIWDYTYNSEFEVQSLKNPLNQTTSYLYDNNGRVSQITYPNSDVIQLEYDEIGNIKKIKADPKGWHEMIYTLFGGISSYVLPLIGPELKVVGYSYNKDNQLIQIQREDSSIIDFEYNSSGIMSAIFTPEGGYSFNRNLYTNQITSTSSPSGISNQYVYLKDALDTHSIVDGANQSSYKYTYSNLLPASVTLRHIDSNSNVSHVANIVYNNDRLMTTIGNLTLTRTPTTGFVATTSLTGGMNETNTYDSTYGEISQYLVRYNTTNKFREAYTRDLLGRITRNAVTINSSAVVNYDYVYDTRGRLIEAKTNNVIQRKYTYDTNSNRTQVRNASNVVLATGIYNDQDQLTNYQIKNTSGVNLNNFNYTYDDYGNRLTKIDTVNNIREEYTYNSLGALTSYIRRNNTTNAIIKNITYQNDALGRRITRSDNGVLQVRYIYDENIRLVGEVTPNGDTLTHYIYADKSHTPSYMRRGTVNYKFATDAQGSIRYVFNGSTGAVVQAITYDEFGNVLTDSSPGFQSLGYAGGLYDRESKLTRFGARDYDAQTGRWTAKDPIRFNGGDINLYSYSVQDPINYIDPDGKEGYRTGLQRRPSKNGSLLEGTVKYFLGSFSGYLGLEIIKRAPTLPGKCVGVGIAVGSGAVVGSGVKDLSIPKAFQ